MKKMFKDAIIDLGDVKAGNKNVPLFFAFEDATIDDIAKYQVNGKWNYGIYGCSCTNFKVKEEGIYGEYNDSGNSIGPNSKGLSVYFMPEDKNIPITVKKRGTTVLNDKQLPKAQLTYKFKVVR